MFSRTFWLAAADRVAGAVLVSLATTVGTTGNLLTVHWPTAFGVAGAVAVASLASSWAKAASPFGPAGSPSLVDDQPGRHALPD
jgi:hypothetical protein